MIDCLKVPCTTLINLYRLPCNKIYTDFQLFNSILNVSTTRYSSDTDIQSKPLRTKKKETIDLTHCFETLVHLRVLRIK